jgi:hypothetical protein
MSDLDLQADVIDTREIIERFEELESEYDAFDTPEEIKNWAELDEFTILQTTLEELNGNGGDEQWRGDWYPVTLIAESYFTDYAKEMLEDCGTIPSDLPWYVAVDWEETASNIKVDYSEIEIGGTTYFYR